MTDRHTPASVRKESAAKRLRAIMQRRELNIHKVSVLTGVKSSVLSRILSENRDMKASTVVRLAEGLGVSTDYLLGTTKGTLDDQQIEKLRHLVARMDNLLWADVMGKG